MKCTVLVLLLLAFVSCGVTEHIVIDRSTQLRNVEVKEDWWESAVIYQIYPRSFKDSNNDGIGDLQGIIQKLDHLQDAGVTATWLSPIFKSPQVDQGYDISDYRDVDPIFGTLDDLKELIEKAHELGIKIILDFVPNHTSDQHQWFKDSVARKFGFEDFYIWRSGTVDEDGQMHPPNNWISVFKGSAWTWNEDRQQYYFHQFGSAQPDLNYRNERVVEAMKDVLKYWLDFGVDGFRIDAVPHLFEDSDFRDEPLANNSDSTPNDWEYLDHIYTKDLNETFDLIYEWREFLDNYTLENAGDTRIMMTEAYTTFQNVLRYYRSSDGRKGAHFSFNFDFIPFDETTTAERFGYYILDWYFQSLVYNWVLGNHDNHRVATRFGPRKVDGLNMLTAILEGVQVIYNGEEIGQEDGEVTCEEGQDPSAIKNCTTFDQVSRDFERTPFQWDDSVNAGFNDGAKPWLPVSDKYTETNLAKQKGSNPKTHYNVYKEMSKIRKSLKRFTNVLSVTYDTNSVLQTGRIFTNQTHVETFSLLFNLSNKTQLALSADATDLVEIILTDSSSGYNIGDKLNATENILLSPQDCIIIYKIEENPANISTADSSKELFY